MGLQIFMSEEIKKTTVKAEAVEEKKHNHEHGESASHSHKAHHEHKHEEKTEETTSFTFEKFTETLDKFFTKQAPVLPTNAKEILVKIFPYLSAIGLVLGVFGILFSIVLIPLLLLGGNIFTALAMLISLASLVLSAIALPGLFSKTKKGWTYSYYSLLVSLLSSIISGNLLGFILAGLIGGYILFQIRSYYK
jgi:hypothetical protein